MIISCSDIQQDTIRISNIVIKESIRLNTYLLPEVRQFTLKDSVKRTFRPALSSVNETIVDTTSVCTRNSIADVTFYDSTNFIINIEPDLIIRFPFIFTEKTRLKQAEAKATLVKHLYPGQNMPVKPLHDDLIILIILISAFLFTAIRTTYKNIFPEVISFFMFRRINDPHLRKTGGLLNWQLAIFNLISFMIIGLFTYCLASFYNFIPAGIPGITGYFLSVGIIMSAVIIRHIACLITGNMSGKRDVFREYIIGIYQSYRISALILFIIIFFLSYTLMLPAKVFFFSGIVIFCIMYLVRVIRLLIIFMNRNISIFYLILYLCALEILPVGISVKYFTGLF